MRAALRRPAGARAKLLEERGAVGGQRLERSAGDVLAELTWL